MRILVQSFITKFFAPKRRTTYIPSTVKRVAP